MSVLLALSLVAVALGSYLLFKGSDLFVEGAASLARSFKVSEHVIGLTIVALATSLPELAASITAASGGHEGIVVGNVVGSNIANLGLVLGFTACVATLVPSKEARRDGMFMVFVTLLVFAVALADGAINWIDGVLLLAIYFLYMGYAVKKSETPPVEADDLGRTLALVLTIAGAVGVVFGAYLLVEGGVTIALSMGIEKVIIGLTVVAIGTSLPELATSVAAGRKERSGIAVGNVIGSNISNLLLILGIVCFIVPLEFHDLIIERSYPFLIGISAFGLFMTYRRPSRVYGIVLLALYVAFILLLR